MKFSVRIRKKHLAALVRETPDLATPTQIFELALEIGLRALTAAGRGKAPKA